MEPTDNGDENRSSGAFVDVSIITYTKVYAYTRYDGDIAD